MVRSIKHYVNEILRDCGSGDTHLTLAHVFNIIFGDEKILTHMTNGVQATKNKIHNKANGIVKDNSSNDFVKVEEKEVSPPGEETDVQGKKKKKRNKKKKIKSKIMETLEIPEIYNKYQLLVPEEFFNKIIKIAISRYSYKPGAEKMFHEMIFMCTKMGKLAFLRDICNSLGLTIAEKDYKFDTSPTKIDNSIEYPFKPVDFLNFTVKCKSVTNPVLIEFKSSIENALRMVKDNQIPQAFRHTVAHLNLLTNIFGIFHQETIDHAILLSKLMYMSNQKDHAEEMLKIILKIQEKVHGIDNNETLETMKKLGRIYLESKQYEEAIQINLKC